MSAGYDVTISCARRCGYEYRWQFRLPIHDYGPITINENGSNILSYMGNPPNVTVHLTLSDENDCLEGQDQCNIQVFRLTISNVSTELNGTLVSCGFFNQAIHYYPDPIVLIIYEKEQATTQPSTQKITVSSTTTTISDTTDEATTPPTNGGTSNVTELETSTEDTNMTNTVSSTSTQEEKCTPTADYTTQPCECNGSSSNSGPTSAPTSLDPLIAGQSINNTSCIPVPVTVIAAVGTGMGIAIVLICVFAFTGIYCKCIQDKNKHQQDWKLSDQSQTSQETTSVIDQPSRETELGNHEVVFENSNTQH